MNKKSSLINIIGCSFNLINVTKEFLIDKRWNTIFKLTDIAKVLFLEAIELCADENYFIFHGLIKAVKIKKKKPSVLYGWNLEEFLE